MSVLKEIVVTEIAEDLVCGSYCKDEGLFSFAGAMGVGYIYSLPGPSKDRQVTISLDDDDETQ